MKTLRTVLSLSCCAGIAGCAAGTSSPMPGTAVAGDFSPLAARHAQPPARRDGGSANGPLHVFQGPPDDGGNPWAGLVNLNGTLYGTTAEGGGHNLGAVFSITTGGTEKLIYSFKGGRKDGQYPTAALTDVGGTLYGTTTTAGPNDDGIVFSVTTTGTEKVVYAFGSSGDGASPDAGLLYHGGALYGTTSAGGTGAGGTVFSLTKTGKENWLYSFKGGSDGATPRSALVYANGLLYGTTETQGGSGAYGTVFQITTSGSETPLHSFSGAPSDGAYPQAGVIAYKGNLYGTTEYGGVYNDDGTVFEVTAAGKESIIHNFGMPSSGDGVNPSAALLNVSGTFYGTTLGALEGSGTVFSITPKGKEEVVYAFGGGSCSSCGTATPEDPVIDVDGVLYGTTLGGGVGYGTVFAVQI